MWFRVFPLVRLEDPDDDGVDTLREKEVETVRVTPADSAKVQLV